MDPRVWGPPLWDVLFASAHSGALGASDAARLFGLLRAFLPCDECRNAYAQSYEALVARRDAGAEPVEWLWMVHDLVNQKLGKPFVACDLVRRRLGALPCAVSPLLVYDLLVLLALHFERQGDAAALEALREAAPLLGTAIHPRALDRLGEPLGGDGDDAAVLPLSDWLLSRRMEALARMGGGGGDHDEKEAARADAERRYGLCTAAVDAAPTSRRLVSSRRRRL